MEKDAPPDPLTVLFPEGEKVSGVPDSRAGRCLDLDAQEFLPPLHDQVHFLASGRTPIEDLRAVQYAAVSPGKEIGKHEILKMRAVRFLPTGQPKRQARVGPLVGSYPGSSMDFQR